MTAPPCPSAEELARDPQLCPVCGHWCGKGCEKRWAPLSIVELRALVNAWRILRYSAAGEGFDAPLDKEAFGEWLNGRTTLTGAEREQLPRGILDGAWSAVFEAISDAVTLPSDTDPICQTIRELITAERALAVGDPQSNERLAELARVVRERGPA